MSKYKTQNVFDIKDTFLALNLFLVPTPLISVH